MLAPILAPSSSSLQAWRQHQLRARADDDELALLDAPLDLLVDELLTRRPDLDRSRSCRKPVVNCR